MKIPYLPYSPRPVTRDLIEQADAICAAYASQGYNLTLRQLYYQFVSRVLLLNTEASYKRLGRVINDARMAGMIDWDHIVDRTRIVRSLPHWDDPADVIASAADGYRTDRWATQPVRVEVWIEKDALAGVLDAVCPDEDVSYFSCRGYTSSSEIWGASQRILGYLQAGQRVVLLHLGDHDPSGLDMTRDIRSRLDLMLTYHLGHAPDLLIERIALNMDQVIAGNLPPNPAKVTDSRLAGYVAAYGDQSWELDALDPPTLTALIRQGVNAYRDPALWAVATDSDEAARARLIEAAERWDDVTGFLDGNG